MAKLRALNGLQKVQNGWQIIAKQNHLQSEPLRRGWYEIKLNIQCDAPEALCPNLHLAEQSLPLSLQGDAYRLLFYLEQQQPVQISISDEIGLLFQYDGRIQPYPRYKIIGQLARRIYQRESAKGESIHQIGKRVLAGIRRYGFWYLIKNLHRIPQIQSQPIKLSYKQWQQAVEIFNLPPPQIKHLFIWIGEQSPPTALDCIWIKNNQNLSQIKNHPAEWLTLIDGEQHISPHYLPVLSQYIKQHPADLYYSDHDYLERGRRVKPQLKPQWSPDYYLEYDYIGSVISLKKELVLQYGIRPHQVLIPAALEQASIRIERIPYVLWHQLAEPLSLEQRQALLLRYGLHSQKRPHSLRILYDHVTPSVDIIIPSRDRPDLLKRCLDSLQKTDYPDYRLIIINNGAEKASTRAYLQKIRSQAQIIDDLRLFNYSALNNQAVAQSQADLICLLNDDTEIIDPHWLDHLVAHASRPEIGCVGAKLLYPDRRIQHAGVVLGVDGIASHVFQGQSETDSGYMQRIECVQNYSAVTAACLLIKRSLWQQLGGLNEKELGIAFNDIDLCLRILELGHRVLYCPDAVLIHHESASRPKGSDSAHWTEKQYMQLRWQSYIQNDPAYHPYLSKQSPAFELSLPESEPAINPIAYPYAYESNEQRIAALWQQQRYESVPCKQAGLSILILNRDKPELIGPLLEQLGQAQHHLDFELQILIADTGSQLPEVKQIYQRYADQIECYEVKPYHFSRCNNRLFQWVRCDHCLFMNNDIIFEQPEQSLRQLYQKLLHYPDSIIGAYLNYPDGRCQHAGIDWIREGKQQGLCYHRHHGEWLSQRPEQQVMAVTGAFLALPSALFEACGRFAEQYQVEAQDVDLCLKARRLGAAIYLLDLGKIIHLENATRPKGEVHAADRARYLRHWSNFLIQLDE